MNFLYKVYEYLRTHKVKSIISIFILAFGIPFLIHCAFYFNAPWTFLIAKWGAGDLLVYYASLLATTGTILLGLIAVAENRQLRDDEITRQNREKETRRLNIKPDISIREIRANKINKPGDYQVTVAISSTSLNTAYNLSLENINIKFLTENRIIKIESAERFAEIANNVIPSHLCGYIQLLFPNNISFDCFYFDKDTKRYKFHVEGKTNENNELIWDITQYPEDYIG